MSITSTPSAKARFAGILTAVALATGSLVAAAPANAVAFSNPVISGLKTKYVLPKSTQKVNFSYKFVGEAETTDLYYGDYAADYTSAKITLVKSRVSASKASKPVLMGSYTYSQVAPGANLGLYFNLNYYTTPGLYQVTVPVTKRTWNTTTNKYDTVTRTTTAQFTIVGSTAVSRASTNYYLSGKLGKKFTGRLITEDYYRGAKVTVYYKASGKKKYKKIATAKVNSSGTAKIVVKKGKIKKKGKAYFKVSGVTYAPTYTTKAVSMKSR